MSEGVQQEWITTTLSAFGELHCGQSPPSEQVNVKGAGVPYVSGPEQWDGTRLHLGKWTTASCRLAPEASIFITVKGAGVGTMFPGTASAIGRDIYAFEPSKRMDARFVFRALEYSIKDVIARAHGDIPGLTKNHILDHQIMIPGRKAQQAVASKIDELFSSIDEGERALERVRKLVERYRQSVLKAAVTGELTREWREQHAGELESGEALLTRILEARRQAWEQSELAKMTAKDMRSGDDAWKQKYLPPACVNDNHLPNLPTGWVWVRAEQICGFITKGTTPSPSAMSPNTGDIPYIKVYNLTFNGSLDFAKDPTFISLGTHSSDLNRSKVVPGDVLMNIVGPPLGKVSIVPETFPEWNMNQAIAVFRPVEGIDCQFLAFYLLNRAAQEWYKRKAKATAGQFNLTLEICRDTPIPLPSLREQIKIRELLKVEYSREENLSSILEREGARSSSLKQSVLSAAFSGQLVPQNLTDEPASVLLERIAVERAAAPKRPTSRQTRAKKTTKSKAKA